LYYGSGFTDVHSHLPGHTTFDLSLSKSVAENVTLSLTAWNLANRRFLLDNSPTFGGTHYADPRQIMDQRFAAEESPMLKIWKPGAIQN